MKSTKYTDVGVFGGSGFYNFLSIRDEGNPEIKPVTGKEVVEIFNRNIEKLREILFKAIPRIPKERKCICSHALEGSLIS